MEPHAVVRLRRTRATLGDRFRGRVEHFRTGRDLSADPVEKSVGLSEGEFCFPYSSLVSGAEHWEIVYLTAEAHKSSLEGRPAGDSLTERFTDRATAEREEARGSPPQVDGSRGLPRRRRILR